MSESRMSEVGGRRSGVEQSEECKGCLPPLHAATISSITSSLANIDRRWRRACVLEVSKQLSCRQPEILDVGCGTGDLSLAFLRPSVRSSGAISATPCCKSAETRLPGANRRIRYNCWKEMLSPCRFLMPASMRSFPHSFCATWSILKRAAWKCAGYYVAAACWECWISPCPGCASSAIYIVFTS